VLYWPNNDDQANPPNSIDDTFFARRSEDNKIYSWDLRDGKVVSTIDDVHRGVVRDMNFSSGTLVTCSFDKIVKVWT